MYGGREWDGPDERVREWGREDGGLARIREQYTCLQTVLWNQSGIYEGDPSEESY